MAKFFLKEIALLFVFWVVYTQVKNWLQWRSLRKFGKKHGCGEAPVVPNYLPGGIEKYGIFLKGMKGMLEFPSNLPTAIFRSELRS